MRSLLDPHLSSIIWMSYLNHSLNRVSQKHRYLAAVKGVLTRGCLRVRFWEPECCLGLPTVSSTKQTHVHSGLWKCRWTVPYGTESYAVFEIVFFTTIYYVTTRMMSYVDWIPSIWKTAGEKSLYDLLHLLRFSGRFTMSWGCRREVIEVMQLVLVPVDSKADVSISVILPAFLPLFMLRSKFKFKCCTCSDSMRCWMHD